MAGKDYLRLIKILGWELVISCAVADWGAMRKFLQGKGVLPDEVIARLDFLAELVGHLEGGYNQKGICQWFKRHRRDLPLGQAPAQIFNGDWRPEDYGPRKVMELAKQLSGPMNTT